MSYRDLRNFSEAMRALGFPKPISLESFRTPNWELVEACLRWLAARIEPDAVLSGGRETVDQRVTMVLHAIELFHSRANLKLNGKKLYGADGWAVREMLKVTALLRTALDAPAQDQQEHATPLLYDISSRVGEIKQARTLATDITAQGAFLYDLLAKEPENKEIRSRALRRSLEPAATEAAIRRAVSAAASRAADVRDAAEAAASARAALDAKLERRRADLQRAEKRLHTVQKIKPAYQGELSALEGELEELWEQYVLRYRCVEALKHQLSLLETAQAEAAEEQQASIMQLIHKYETEDVLGKLSESDEMDSSEEEQEVKQPRPATRPRTRLRIKTAGKDGEGRGAWVAGRESLDIRDEDDSRSDSDLSDERVYAAAMAGGSGRWSRRPATRTLAASDDQYADLIEGVGMGGGREGSGSLGSSSESELRLASPRPARADLSDNEF